jgi:hypothetical protein
MSSNFYVFVRCLVILVGSVAQNASAADPFTTGPAWGHGWPYDTVTNKKTGKAAIGRVDIDSDLNFDGVITNDGTEGGKQESTPPGQIIGHKQMTKVIFRITPFATPRDTEIKPDNLDNLICSLELRALNQSHSAGQFASEDAARQATGHVKVWSDAKRSLLLLDSRDKNKGRIEWKINSPNAPAHVYIECVDLPTPEVFYALTLNIDDVGSKEYSAKKINPYASRDWILFSFKEQSPEVKPAENKRYGNYHGFAKEDREGSDIWIQN